MKFIFPLFAFLLLFTSCFTTSLLNSKVDISSLPADSYSFNRAFYTPDSLLHIDFNNLKNSTSQNLFLSITIDINNILTEYDEHKLLRGKYCRQYNVKRISDLVCDSSCGVNYGNTSLLTFGDFKVHYSADLEPIQDSTLLTYTDLLNDQCVVKSTNIDRRNEYEVPENDPKDVYVLQTLRDPNRFVALRIPLINRGTKLSLLPLTIMLDIITSPFQFGFYVVTHKGENNDEHKKSVKHENQPINTPVIHRPR